tara:strand:+ start:1246 stop:1710 length:465 start_codon:yes stop_codon:yes gene_type:complete
MIQAIYIAPKPGAAQQAMNNIDVIAGKGILGDRNYDQHRWHGQNITLVEIENIQNFDQQYQQHLTLDATRRNLITKGVALNELIGQTFFIGSTKLIGTERCEPCLAFSQQLASDTVSKQQVFDAFTSKAGIRATILSDGVITMGMPITVNNAKS